MSAPGVTMWGIMRPSPVGPLPEKSARFCCHRSAPLVDAATVTLSAPINTLAASPSCEEIDAHGIVTPGAFPPITTVGVNSLSYTSIATAPAACTAAAFSENVHVPLSTSATFPLTASPSGPHASRGDPRTSVPVMAPRPPKAAHDARTSCSTPEDAATNLTKSFSFACFKSDSAVLCCAPTHSMFFAVAGDPIVYIPRVPSLPAAHTARKSLWSRANASTSRADDV
mmetsp:Transcript_63091/g.150555  ORF Transcript_63091/g.150555 Transcript_63091/m.150555 type:complete len:227 (-) Transcript_63091:380-1060(-)